MAKSYFQSVSQHEINTITGAEAGVNEAPAHVTETQRKLGEWRISRIVLNGCFGLQRVRVQSSNEMKVKERKKGKQS